MTCRGGFSDIAAVPLLRRSGGLLLDISSGATEDVGPYTTLLVEGKRGANPSRWSWFFSTGAGAIPFHVQGAAWPPDTVWPQDEMVRVLNYDHIASMVGPAPRTRPSTLLPASTDRAAEAPHKDAEEDLDADQLLRSAVVGLLSQQKKKKAKATGLPLGGGGSDSEEDETADPLRRLAGARGTMLSEKLRQSMELEPRSYIAAIDLMAAQMLGEAQTGPATMERCCRELLPMGAERSLGYLTWGIARALTLLRAGHADKAHLILLLLVLVASVEQYRLQLGS